MRANEGNAMSRRFASVVVVVVILLLALYLASRRRSSQRREQQRERTREEFGSEYDRAAVHAVLMASRSDDPTTTTGLYNHFAGRFFGWRGRRSKRDRSLGAGRRLGLEELLVIPQ